MLAKRRFSYYKKEYKNPFFRINRRRVNFFPDSKKRRIIIFAIFLFFGSLIWFFFFSNYFTIKTIVVSGSENINTENIKNLAWEETKDRWFLLGKQNNIFLFSKSNFINKINAQFSLMDIKIKKKLPDKIDITLKEKKYSFVWLEDEKYYYIDNEGNLIAEIGQDKSASTPAFLIVSKGNAKIANNKIGYDKKYLDFINKVCNQIKDNKFVPEMFILDTINTVKFKIKQGQAVIFLNIDEDLDKQINKLSVVINEKLKDDFKNKEYIDLRYGDKVYYK